MDKAWDIEWEIDLDPENSGLLNELAGLNIDISILDAKIEKKETGGKIWGRQC